MPYVSGLLSLQRACLEAGIAFEFFYVSGPRCCTSSATC